MTPLISTENTYRLETDGVPRLRHMRVLALATLLLAATLLACPPDDKKAPAPASPKACEKVGQSCEFSPGKLGTCVQKDDCKTANCFDCQSQH